MNAALNKLWYIADECQKACWFGINVYICIGFIIIKVYQVFDADAQN